MAKQQSNRALMMTIFLISLIQMPQFAILPGTNLIATKVFPEMAFQAVQTAMSLPGIIAVFAGILSAMMVRYGLASKKILTVIGLMFLSMAGVVALFLHARFWQLCFMNLLIGAAMGTFIPSSQSIMFDNFDEKTRQFISGVQFSCINGGGLLMSLLCGLLTTFVWYGGHLIMLIVIPIVVVAYLIIPKDTKMKPSSEDGTARVKLPSRSYYYTVLIIIFMIIYNVATMNISTHLELEGLGDSSTAGIATALLMGGGVVAGFLFAKLSATIRDQLFAVTFFLLAIGFALMSLFPASLTITFAAMFICGSTMSLLVPRCIFNVSNLSEPSNSATATLLVCCIAPGGGHFLSPIIMTNLTMALGGESTRFRFLFTAIVCLVLAVVLLFYTKLRSADRKGAIELKEES